MKKGQIEPWLIYTILFITFAIIISLFFLKPFFDSLDRKSDSQICKESVLLNSVLQSTLDEFSNSILCPTKDVFADSQSKVADEIHDCWDKFYQGRQNLFNDEGIFCVVCSRINLENDISGINHYLLTHNVPGEDLTYSDYLSNYETTGASEVLDELRKEGKIDLIKDETLVSSKTYAVILQYAKGRSSLEKIKAKTKPIVSTLSGVSVAYGLMKVSNYLMLVPIPQTKFIALPTRLLANLARLKLRAAGYGLAAGSIAGGSVWTALTDANPEWVSLITLRPYESSTLDEMGCEYFPADQNSFKE